VKEGRGKEGMGGRRGEGNGEGMGTEGKRGERGPQFKKNDPPSSDGWLRAWFTLMSFHCCVAYKLHSYAHCTIVWKSFADDAVVLLNVATLQTSTAVKHLLQSCCMSQYCFKVLMPFSSNAS